MEDPWSELSPRVVMVARYAERDGIARYADQLIAADTAGRRFLRVGIPEGPGDYHRTFHAGPRALWLLRDAKRGDDVVLHYHPHYYIRGGAPARIASYASWGLLSLLRRVTVVAHEPDPETGPALEEKVRAWAWRRVPRIVFHSDWQRDRHVARFGTRSRQRLVVIHHGDFYATSLTASRTDARDRLGLPQDRTILLMIGFISATFPDKGYDRAVAAVQEADEPGVELHIVGSPIREDDAIDALMADLREAAAAGPQITLHEGFVDDETFDLWVRAADAVLTPYRTASSSGVVARAQLLGTPVVTSDVGGLVSQAGPGDVVVRDDDELVQAVRRVSSSSR